MREKKKIKLGNFRRHPQTQIRKLMLNKKAASVVVSTIILTAGVLAMSIAVLYWTYSMGKIGNNQYQKSTTISANATQERLGYEYINGAGNTLTAYIINWGEVGDLNVTHVLILDSSYKVIGANSGTITLYTIGTQTQPSTPIPGNRLGTNSDGSFTASLTLTLNSGQFYYIRTVTGRGRTFDASFIAR